MNPEIDFSVTILLAIICMFLVVVMLIAIASKIHSFKRKLDYLNMEIERTQGRERQYWKQKKKRLWLSLLPFSANGN